MIRDGFVVPYDYVYKEPPPRLVLTYKLTPAGVQAMNQKSPTVYVRLQPLPVLSDAVKSATNRAIRKGVDVNDEKEMQGLLSDVHERFTAEELRTPELFL